MQFLKYGDCHGITSPFVSSDIGLGSSKFCCTGVYFYNTIRLIGLELFLLFVCLYDFCDFLSIHKSRPFACRLLLRSEYPIY